MSNEGALPTSSDDPYAQTVLDGLLKAGTKAEALASLPTDMRGQVAFQKVTRGRHPATPEFPRAIRFSRDARVIVASSGIKHGPFQNELEVMIADDKSGRYRMLTVSYENGQAIADYDETRCTGCHDDGRIVFRDYPNWKGSVGGERGHDGVDQLTSGESEWMRTFASRMKSDPDYQDIDLDLSSDHYSIRGSHYGLPLTVFTARAANVRARHLATQIAKRDNVEKFRYALLASALDCPLSEAQTKAIDADYATCSNKSNEDSVDLKLFRLLGIDPARQMRLDLTADQSSQAAGKEFEWSSGSDSLKALVGFNVLKDTLDRDLKLKKLFEPSLDVIQRTYDRAFRMKTPELLALDQNDKPLSRNRSHYNEALFPFLHFYIYPPTMSDKYTIYDEDGALSGANRKREVCEYLASARSGNVTPEPRRPGRRGGSRRSGRGTRSKAH